MAVCEHCGVGYEPSNGWFMRLCSVCFRLHHRPPKPQTIAEHVERYFDVYYDALPDGDWVVAVIDRRPEEPSADEVSRMGKAELRRHLKKRKNGYAAPPFFMRCSQITRQWDFWKDDDAQQRVRGRIKRWSTISQVDPGRVPRWVRGTEN